MLLLEGTETKRDLTGADEERVQRRERRRARIRDAALVAGTFSIVAGILLTVLLAPRGLLGEDVHDSGAVTTAGHPSAAVAAAPSAAEAKRVKFEPFERVNPDLPATPAGAVKRFKVDVYEHVTKVSDDLAPTEVWSYGVNGKLYRGTGVSAPMVVTEGDKVEITLVNGGSEKMNVRMPHSIDYHSSEVAPNEAFVTIPPGAT